MYRSAILATIVAAAASTSAVPAHAGVTETALAVCTTAAHQTAPGATVSTRKIVEGGRTTKISLWIKADSKRVFDCAVGAKGDVVAAFADQDKGTALANANPS